MRLEEILKNYEVLPNGCHRWLGADTGKYGRVWYNGRDRGAHRVILEWKLGRDLGVGEFAMHTCDNPICVNPEHLNPGTAYDNAMDMVSKGRNHNQKKTHCKYGHPFTQERARGVATERVCLVCKTRRSTETKRRKRLQKKLLTELKRLSEKDS